MPSAYRKPFLILSGILIVIVPLIVNFSLRGGLPAGFGVFPPQLVGPEPGFNWLYFLFGVAVAIIITAAYLFPAWFGFKPTRSSSRRVVRSTADFSIWFWPGLVVWLVCWVVMWGQFEALGWLRYYTFVPLWWGFILALDGVVYRRNGGKSLISTRPGVMVLIGLSSCVGWYLFEYLDYFVFENWYYPNNTLLSHTGYLVWFGLAYTTVIPSVFEWYTLFNTFDFIPRRYVTGPQISLSPVGWWIMYGVGLFLMFGLSYWSFIFFYAVWLGPLALILAALMLTGYWTPVTPLAKGNWSPLGLIALACMVNYFFGEMWNFWSPPNNPNFWKYDVPYVNGFHIFEMPLLGFYGYLPFGILCWVWWLYTAHLLNWKFDIHLLDSPVE